MNEIKYKAVLLIVMFASVVVNQAHAQGIWSAQLRKDTGPLRVRVMVEIYRQGNVEMSEKVVINWGDGTEEALTILGNQYVASANITAATYPGLHYYEETGLYELSFVDSFLIDNIENIENSGEKALNFKDTVNIFSADNPDNNNDAPVFLGHPDITDIIVESDGVVKYPTSYLSDTYMSVEGFRISLVPFPAEGYSPPPGSLYMDENVLVWDKPLEPGFYGVCIKVREFRKGRVNPEDSLFMGTAHRALILEISPDMIVSTFAPGLIDGVVSVYPNPVADQLHFQLSHFRAEDALLQVLNPQGQVVYTEKLRLSNVLQEHSLSVADWPAGVYVLRVQSGERQWVRKFVVQK
jgi:hypothetical protein